MTSVGGDLRRIVSFAAHGPGKSGFLFADDKHISHKPPVEHGAERGPLPWAGRLGASRVRLDPVSKVGTPHFSPWGHPPWLMPQGQHGGAGPILRQRACRGSSPIRHPRNASRHTDFIRHLAVACAARLHHRGLPGLPSHHSGTSNLPSPCKAPGLPHTNRWQPSLLVQF